MLALHVEPANRSPASKLGLGCSKFGSIINGIDGNTADRLIAIALELGVRHFDTADIYGQGDSERMLGRRLRAAGENVVIATKVGQRFPLMQRAMRPLKVPIAAFLRTRSQDASRLSQVRAKPLPRCYEPYYIRRAVSASLKRLRLETVDLVYLHSPTIMDLRNGAAVETLDKLRKEGFLRKIGVSCDDLDSARQALLDSRVSFLQVPYLPSAPDWKETLVRANEQNVSVVLRSVFSGADSGFNDDERRKHVIAAARELAVDTVLIGTKNERHLRQLASWI